MFLALTLCLSVSATTLSVIPSSTVTSFVSIRSQPDKDAKLLAALRPGNSVPVIGAVGDWYVVNWEGATGYISRAWVEITTGDSASADLDALKEQVTKDKIIPIDSVSSFVRVREQPDMNSKMIAALYQGQALPLISETADWYVVTAAGQTGYISRAWGQKIGAGQTPVASYPGNETMDMPADIVDPDQALPVIESAPLPVIAPIEKSVVREGDPVLITPADSVKTSVMIRAKPSTDGAILSRLPPKNSVIMIGESDDWYTVVRNGQTGYVSRYWTKKVGGAGNINDSRTLSATELGVDEIVLPPVAESQPMAETVAFSSSDSDPVSDTIAIMAEDSPKYPPARPTVENTQPIIDASQILLQSDRQPGDRARMMTATELLERGETISAYSTLSELAPAWAGHAGFDYLLGVAALSNGNAAEAVFSLDRVVYALPGFVGARLELARALYEVGDYGRARKEFQALLDAQPPAAVREIILEYLDALTTAGQINLESVPFENTLILGEVQ